MKFTEVELRFTEGKSKHAFTELLGQEGFQRPNTDTECSDLAGRDVACRVSTICVSTE